MKVQDLIVKKEARIRELEAENAALKKVIEIDDCGREIIEARDKEIARKDAALAAADKMNEILNASSSGHFWADIADAQEEYITTRALIAKAKEEKA